MVKLEVELSNEGARTAAAELRAFLEHENEKMAGAIRDPAERGALGWVIGKKILTALEAEIERQEAREAEIRRKRAPTPPSVRKVRKGV